MIILARNVTFNGLDDDDFASGGNGDDVLYGGAGADTFVFDGAATTGEDTIYDWTDADTIELSSVTLGDVTVTSTSTSTSEVKWSCFFGQFCGLAKMHSG